ncbi:MAG: Arm DNA-binding domain-containing protein [Chromatiales bacterium]|nr:Arm DNA-binding domain-containing protein [Chromatiales bacterium]
MRLNFTKKTLEELPNAEAGKRAYYHDTKVNGLLVAVTAAGVKSFQVYRKLSNKPVRVTLGRFPDMTIDQARRQAPGRAGASGRWRQPQRREEGRAGALRHPWRGLRRLPQGSEEPSRPAPSPITTH